ncbi:MAG: glutamate 5-kinase [Marinicaulis sp.]|nr:glutamate 5-kinase [Marinicaulis sp.]NNE41733.1 glutamate 5-kinase [Marinicaulis sp.]NNL89925.1 glutamate 5-kinase [Marinicaulis sp.]
MSEVEQNTATALAGAKRIVLKIGSALLCGDAGNVRGGWLRTVAEDIAKLRMRGCEVIVVSSGAVALGRRLLKCEGSIRLEEKQACSAAGQAALIRQWQHALDAHDILAAQVLLTLDDTENRKRYLNARAAMRALLELGVLPVINENDTVATSELRYGDNDRLAAHAAQIVGADVLIMLSDVDGVYTGDPRRNGNATHLSVVDAFAAETADFAAGPNQRAGVGSGGMASKIAAAKIASANGCVTIIASGLSEHPVRAILDGAAATLLPARGTAESARKQWIGGRISPAGIIIIDNGAARALQNGASLLPAGVIKVEGNFLRGDAVSVLNESGEEIAQGLVTYDTSDLSRIAGEKSEAIESILGLRRRPAVIEKDDLVLRGILKS